MIDFRFKRGFKTTEGLEIIPPDDGDEARVRAGFWPKIRGAVRQIPFANDAVAAYYCAFDPATPRRVRLTLMATLAYFIVPADAMPDFIAGLGYTDDATVIAAAIKMLGHHVKDRHRDAALRALEAPEELDGAEDLDGTDRAKDD